MGFVGRKKSAEIDRTWAEDECGCFYVPLVLKHLGQV